MMRSDFVFDLGQSRGAPRLIAGLRDHRKYRLPVEQDFLGREDRIIVFAGRAYVIAAGDVRRSEDVDDAKRGPDRIEIRRENPAMGNGRQSERSVQRSGRLGQVVGIFRAARDMFDRRFVKDVLIGCSDGRCAEGTATRDMVVLHPRTPQLDGFGPARRLRIVPARIDGTDWPRSCGGNRRWRASRSAGQSLRRRLSPQLRRFRA